MPLGCFHAHSQFENRSTRKAWPEGCLSCVALPDVIVQTFEPSYPEGNFEGNQLLGGSIGLSPLCLAQATQFARQNSELTSAAVSHGFIIARDSSPPFGSHGPGNHSEPCPLDFRPGATCNTRLVSPEPQRALATADPHDLPIGLLMTSSTLSGDCCCLHHTLWFSAHTIRFASAIDSLIRVSRRAEDDSTAPSWAFATARLKVSRHKGATTRR